MKPGKRERENLSWNVQFAHKIMSDVNLNSIINHAGVKYHLPHGLQDKMDICIIYHQIIIYISKVNIKIWKMKNKRMRAYKNTTKISLAKEYKKNCNI